jgi:flagellar motor switch protein FliN/FliY
MSDEGQAVQEQQSGQMDPSQSGNPEMNNEGMADQSGSPQANNEVPPDQSDNAGANGENAEEQADMRTQAQSVEFSEAVETEVAGPAGSIDILLDMKVPITVTIGQTELPVQRLLRLGHGSVLRLDKSIDEPVELYLRDAKFATGSVVVVDGRFAVKIKQILNPATLK